MRGEVGEDADVVGGVVGGIADKAVAEVFEVAEEGVEVGLETESTRC